MYLFSFQTEWSKLQVKLVDFGLNLLIAIAILIIGFKVVSLIGQALHKVLEKQKLDESLRKFLQSVLVSMLKILVVVTALAELGLEMTSFVALLGAAGLAVGMAFSGSLQNFAGGVMLLVFKPFKLGDFVTMQGETGTVKEIQIFQTVLTTVDNKTIFLPNGQIINGNITNFSHQETRRVDFTIGIGYGDKYETAVEALKEFISKDDRILSTPEPFIGLVNLNDSSVDIALRVWTKTEDYWPVYFNINKMVYENFDDKGLNIPFPQMDVHVHNVR
ncbi:MAG: mechanosensitive ion channel [Crocinitomicaceae bacterium]|nr:mechanosensitive ion channel [Crocinitomicaceae bacterium]